MGQPAGQSTAADPSKRQMISGILSKGILSSASLFRGSLRAAGYSLLQTIAICLVDIEYYSAAKVEPKKSISDHYDSKKRQIAHKPQLNHRINQRPYLAFWGSSAKIMSHF